MKNFHDFKFKKGLAGLEYWFIYVCERKCALSDATKDMAGTMISN